MVINIQNRKVITQNLYNGEKILKEFKSDFPYIKSNTRYNAIISRHKDDARYSEIIPRLQGQSTISGLITFQIRCTYDSTPKKKLNFLEQAIKYTKVANCQECAFLMQQRFKKAGIPAKNVRMNILQSNGFDTDRNHAFTLIGFDKDADISNPKTWGKNAVIVDGWANIVKRANEGLDYLKQFFKFNPKTELCEFGIHRDM